MPPRRILIVDDDVDFCALLAQGLAARGHAVNVAADAAQALVMAEGSDPEVVLVDIVLPDQNGFNLARELRRRVPRSLIMGLTAFPNPPTQDQLDCGIACMFLKPVDYREIARLIEGWNPPPAA